MRWLLLVVACASFGCEKSRRCHLEGENLVADLRALDQNVAPFDRLFLLAVRDDLASRPLPYANAVAVGPDTPLDRERLKKMYEFDAQTKRFDGRVYLLVDKRATWAQVVATYEAVASVGYTTPMFAFVGSKPNPRPPPSKLDAKIAAIEELDSLDRGEAYAKLMNEVIRDCDAFRKPFHHGDPAKSRTEQLFDDLPKDLVACNCRVDMPSLRALLWNLLGDPVPAYFIAVTPARDGTIVRAKPDVTWEHVNKRIAANTTTLWLSVE